jgi:hypothetical protein
MKRLVSIAGVGVVLLSSGFSSSVARAQAGNLTAAISGFVSVPVGSLSQNQDVAAGGAVALRYAPAAWGQAAARVELSGLVPWSHKQYGPIEQDVPLHAVANGSGALSAMVGPEFDVAAPAGHFFTTVTAGAAHVWATPPNAAPIVGDYYPGTSQAGRQATNFAWSGGGGYMTGRSRAGLAAELGIRYYDFGRVAYVSSFPPPELVPGPDFTVAHHHMTFLAPSLGVSWRP